MGPLWGAPVEPTNPGNNWREIRKIRKIRKKTGWNTSLLFVFCQPCFSDCFGFLSEKKPENQKTCKNTCFFRFFPFFCFSDFSGFSGFPPKVCSSVGGPPSNLPNQEHLEGTPKNPETQKKTLKHPLFFVFASFCFSFFFGRGIVFGVRPQGCQT